MEQTAQEKVFERLYSAHSGDVLSYAIRRGAEYPDAEEVVVETFLVCWRRLSEIPNPSLPWLLAVARRVLANQRRARKRRIALRRKIAGYVRLQQQLSPGESHFPPGDMPGIDRLKPAMASLDDSDREVIALVAWQGLTHEEAATVLGCTRNALTKRYLRACRNLKAQLSVDWT